jgi:hypothetical protein
VRSHAAAGLARDLDRFVEPRRRQASAFPVLTVPLDEKLLSRADAYAAEVKRNLPPEPNHSGIEHDLRYRNGFLGEFAVCILLRELGFRFRYEPRTDGQSDEGPDVYVWMQGYEVGCNVKVGGQPTHQYLMLPESLWQRGPGADLYLGGRLDVDAGACELWGTCWRERVAEAPVRTPNDPGFPRVLAPTRLLRLSVLEPLVETLDALDRGPAEISKAIP